MNHFLFISKITYLQFKHFIIISSSSSSIVIVIIIVIIINLETLTQSVKEPNTIS